MRVVNSVLLYINGNRRIISGDTALQSLLTYLRRDERLTGSKLGCGEGGCGACTVLLSSYCRSSRRIIHRAVNACLLPVASCDGCAVTTIEAVGDRQGGLAPVQAALVNCHGSQCGFCTPGIVMSMFALLRQRAAEGTTGSLTEQEVETNFDGNLCRCTGYRPILDAFKGLVRHENQKCDTACVLGDACCKSSKQRNEAECETIRNDISALSSNSDAKVSSPVVEKEYIFPPELIHYEPPELRLANGKWLRPISLHRFLEMKTQNPQSRIIVGNTELGIEEKFKALKVPVFLCATHVPDLLQISETETGVEIGASVTWTQLNSFIDEAVARRRSGSHYYSTSYKTRSLEAIRSQLRWFAGKQIRNVAGVGGNIITASPISDVNPIWVASGAEFVVLNSSSGKTRKVRARDFFVGYRTVDMSTEEILFHIFLPWNESPFDITHAFKVARRREDDIAIVSAGIRLRLEPESEDLTDEEGEGYQFRISHASLSFGGLAPKTIAVEAAETYLQDQVFCKQTLVKVLEVVSENSKLPDDVPGGMAEYRQCVATGFVFKAFAMTAAEVDKYCIGKRLYDAPFAANALSLDPKANAEYGDEHSVSRAVQISSERDPLCASDSTGKSINHLSAALQVSGEAKYLDDIASVAGELQAALVLSTEASARILSIDFEEAKGMPGVHDIITVRNVKGENLFGPNVEDELCFADDVVTTVGQIIGIVTAETLEQAKNAAAAVRIAYDRLPSVLTIEEAIAAQSFASGVPDHTIQRGDTAEVLRVAKEAGRVVEGTVRIGAQEHWYLEPQGTIAIPDENGEMLILSSTQAPSKTQEVVAKVLGVPMHKVLCKVKRLGGGFGGKESRSLFISAAVAVAAQSSSRPVRLILDRDVDMLISGTRHPFLGQYKAAFEPSGRITALQLRTFLNMGNTMDLSIPVLDRSLFHGVNCYDIPNVNFVGKACYTNTASATAFRGFGGPQGMMIAENVIERVAWATNTPAYRVRELNMFGRDGNSAVTHFGMSFDAEPLVSCWDTVLSDSAFHKRTRAVEDFNKVHKVRKRGIAAVPTMFGISFTFRTYNQAGALVHIFHGDGSVLISHGGVEMGQGLHTKICQVAATVLGIPLEKVFISETATDKVPNASPTAASSSSDLYGMAVKRACEQLLRNLEPIRAELGESASWSDIVHHAWFSRVSLSATGFYKTPTLDQVNLAKPGASGRPFFYYTNGAAVTEVEVDTLTGESRLLRTDIVMDVGRPLNPAIDVGQIEGAFIQGLGWCTMEEVVRGSSSAHAWVKPGQTYTLGPSTYKIPGFCDIPKDFRVRVLDARNEQDTIHSSKAIGEPPLFLAASAFFAIREAVKASRIANGRTEWFDLDSPATVERIRLAAVHDIVDHSLSQNKTRSTQLSL